MAFVASGLVISVILGALAMAVVMRLTRSRRRAPMPRGRVERAIEYGAGVVGGPLTLFIIGSGGTVGPHFAEEIMMLGPTVAMPASAVVTWITGELLSGPTQRSWRPMIFAFLAAQAGFMVPTAILSWLAKAVFPASGVVVALIQSATLVTPFLVGGLASAWAYRRWRSEIVRGESTVENQGRSVS